MYIDKQRYLLLALAAGASIGVVIASQLRRRQHEVAFKRDHAHDLKTWENEGGNVAPDRATAMPS